ncbi:YggT family protein [Rhodovibrio salinarum]|uniref:YggT family protein n=1 Tax=Rhodovibrio salinarum TaxID=1087 RepID=UPI0004816CB9
MVILGPLIEIIIVAIDLYIWAIIISAILSWLIAFDVINTTNRFVYTVLDFLGRVTEPALRPIRNIMPNLGGIDISPIILILGLFFVQRVLANLRYEMMAGGGMGGM